MTRTRRPVADDLVFVGFIRRVAALRRSSGELVWKWKSPLGSGFVALLPDGDVLFASVDGYTFALDPVTGEELWRNPLEGLGTGIACLATMRATTAAAGAAAAQTERDRERSNCSATAGT